jgi:tRNA-dihydrouridine synthase
MNAWIHPPVFVAPMEGVTHFPMRLWLASIAPLRSMTSPFLRVTSVYPSDDLPELFAPELFLLREQTSYELIPQFIATDIDSFLRACKLIPPVVSPMIELNCGCPSPNSMGALAGSGLLRDPKVFGATLEKACQHLGPRRLAIKMRLGIASDDEFPELLQRLCHLPLGRLTIHTRTRADGYRGKARWNLLHEAIAACPFPVISSGDVWGIDSYRKLATEVPGLGGIMVGRGLLRNPWIFREIEKTDPTRMSAETLIQALYVFLLLQHLAHQAPAQLLSKVAQGYCGALCGTDQEAWKYQAALLSKIALGRPVLLLKGQTAVAGELSPVAFSRLRFLWTYLRSGLPPSYNIPRLGKARKAPDFFEALLDIAEQEPEITLCHRPEWDPIFARERG